ncbi:TPA: rubrerythrin [Candidatus Poribacteria bacterium]|nr:rubrerythrin [Candidatus Poribacteria bacterium]
MGTTFKDIISFAIEWEKESAKLYEEMGKLAKKPNAKLMFEAFEKEEIKHREILENLSPEKIAKIKPKKAIDLKISDYLIDMTFKPDIEYQDALIIAMKREEKAVKMYTDLLNKIDDPEAQKLIQFLIQEESNHKLRLETEYDDNILSQC